MSDDLDSVPVFVLPGQMTGIPVGVLLPVAQERSRQDAKWGRSFPGRSHNRWLAILVEEAGEAAKAILQGNLAHTREEVVQIAAVALSWLEFGEFDATPEPTLTLLEQARVSKIGPWAGKP